MTLNDIKRVYSLPFSMQIGLIVAICIFVFLLFQYFFLFPINTKISAAVQDEDTLKAELNSTLLREHQVGTDVSQLPKLKATLAEWSKYYIHQEEIPSLLDQILQLGGDTNLKFNTFTSAHEVTLEGHTYVPFKIQLMGKFDDAATFISKIANLKKLIVIQNFSFTRQAPQDQTEKILSLTNTNSMLIAEINLAIYKK